jgi:hypothetical protein
MPVYRKAYRTATARITPKTTRHFMPKQGILAICP